MRMTVMDVSADLFMGVIVVCLNPNARERRGNKCQNEDQGQQDFHLEII